MANIGELHIAISDHMCRGNQLQQGIKGGMTE